jgi:hypothetical protein
MTHQKAFYSDKHAIYSEVLTKISSKVHRFAWYRFLAFAALFVPVSTLGWTWPTGGITLLLLILFFFLIKKNIELEKQKRKYAVLKKLTEDELLALKHSFSHFQNGEQYLDVNHSYAYDLDLFGEGSVFQFLNRTSTIGGHKKLADWLLNPFTDRKIIDQRQGAVAELAEDKEWRLQFLAQGKLFDETEQQSAEMKSWAETTLQLNKPELVKWLILVIPILTVMAAIPVLLGKSSFFLVLMLLCQLIFMFGFWKRIQQYFAFFGRKSDLLSKYMSLLKCVETKNFDVVFLQSLQKRIKEPSASCIFSELKKLVKQFEYRQNIIVGFVLNITLMWDIGRVYKLWQWHNKNAEKLNDWLEVIAEIDALISLANYANNHTDFIYPEIVFDHFAYTAEELGHPLLKAEKRICNSFEIDGWSKVMIVTGANMAGKSTFLRTVGVNLVLARIGAPVCAAKMKVTPIALYTNMRTTDSLLKDESYFFAELKRIKSVLDRLKSGEHIFVILDEILKGTNSIDKLNGSKELVRKLAEYKAVSVIATHDLKLSEMANEYPENVFNKCFEIKIENNELIFDYKLSNGVTKTMNATFLMKKMGII